MPEGVAVAGQVTAGGVHDDPDAPPPASQHAPKGWTWDRGSKSWKPRQRGPQVWQPGADSHPYPPTAPGGVAAAVMNQFGQQEQFPHDPPAGDPRDPAPSWMAEDAKEPAAAPLRLEDVPQAVKDDIAGLAGLVATPILAMLASVDPYCGGALKDAFGDVLDATLPVICRSERIVRYFTEDTADWLLWGKIALALGPVGKAVAEHHIFRTVQVSRDPATGQVTILRASRPDGQHLTPQVQPEYSPEQYAA